MQPVVVEHLLHTGIMMQTLSSEDIKPGTGELPDEADGPQRKASDWGNLW